jgi:hypothetical protein
MSKTLGEKFDSIETKIDNAENVQSYQTGDGSQIVKGTLFRLYEERDRLLEKIERYGRNYIEGQNTTPMGDVSLVSFS